MAPSTSSIRAHNDLEEARVHLYDVTILGNNILTTVTKCPQAVSEWITDIRPGGGKRHVGFELEVYLDNNTIRIGTAQFCVGGRCLVIQLLHPWPRPPPSLAQFLAHKKNRFVGIDIAFKMQLLANHISLNQEAEVRCMDWGRVGAKEYLRKRPQVEKPKVDHTQWGRPSKLSDDQVHYACVEVFLNREYGRLFDPHSDPDSDSDSDS